MRKLFIPLTAFMLFLLSAGIVSAHPSLVRADPPPNSVVAVSPPYITIWFDEEIDPQLSAINVLDKNQQNVDLKNTTVSPDRKQMRVGLRPNLPPGTYTVAWRVLSSVDGHLVKGIYAIYVGAASVSASANTVNTETSAVVSPFEVGLRWLNLLTALSLFGGLSLNLLMSDTREPFVTMRTTAARRLRTWLTLNILALFVSTVVMFLLQAATAADQSFVDLITRGTWLSLLTSTGFGQASLARILLMDALLVLLMIGSELVERWRIQRLFNVRVFDLIYLGIAAGILLSLSLAAHAAAMEGTLKLALIADWVHLVAVSAWAGGLFTLTLVLRPAIDALPDDTRLKAAHALLRRFSNLAVGCVAVFAISGLYSLWRQVGHVGALATPYGGSLIVKHLFIAPMLLLGLLNTLRLRPDLVEWIQKILPSLNTLWDKLALPPPSRWSATRLAQAPHILRAVHFEALLGLGALLATAAMTALPPARVAAPPPLPPPFQTTRQSGELNIALTIEPFIVGNQTFTVKVTDAQGKPRADVTRVNLRFTFLGTDLGITNAETKPAGDSIFKLEGGYLSVVGNWKVETIIRRKDVEDDLRLAYRLNVTDPTISRSEELPPISGGMLFGLIDIIGGLMLLAYARRKLLNEGQWIGGGAMALGVALIVMSFSSATPTAAGLIVNPIVPDENSLAQGKAVYEKNCLVCHGATGRGNGPLAASLNPRPSDFAIHINVHTDEVIFNWISKGVPGTAMPAWESQLSEADRWHIFNYIQALVEKGK